MGRKTSHRNAVVRTTISVPRAVKERMDEVEEAINWSQLASQAFEAKLNQIDKIRETGKMSDVVSRLRASKQQAESDDYQKGCEVGRDWAKRHAEFSELANLRRSRDACCTDWHVVFEESGGSGGYSPDQWLYFSIRPDDDGDRDLAREFWEAMTPEESPAPSGQWAKGFAEAALAVFDEVADQL